MNPLRCVLVLQFATTLTLAQPVPHNTQPESLVRSLYTQVIAHHPSGLLTDAQIKIVAPYLSKSLLHKIDQAQACSADWNHHNPEPHLKSHLAAEYGLFTGEHGPADAHKFKIDSNEPGKDGSLRVYVTLTRDEKPPERSWDWRVAQIVIREDGHLAVDDVIYLDDNTYDNEADRRNTLLSQYLAAGCNGPHWIGLSLPNQPEALITSLYQQVLTRTPGGIPLGTNWKIFAPYMSKTLQHKIDLALACEGDWDRKHANSRLILKAPFGTSEIGIFSGGDEETEPRTFHIDKTERQKDGSIRVYVTLGLPQYKMTWPVAVILLRENGRFVVDDVIFLKDKATNQDADYRLSQALSSGCRGPHWVGP